jgi:hypothetical protein
MSEHQTLSRTPSKENMANRKPKTKPKVKPKNKPKYNGKHPGGRPPIYDTRGKLFLKIKKYFWKCKRERLIPTIAGCAYATGMDRSSFYDYEKKDEFSDTIKNARNFIIAQWESKLVNTNANAGGIIFIARNYGYTDKQEIQHSGGVKIIRDSIPDDGKQ